MALTKLKQLAQHASIPCTNKQILDIGLTIVRNAKDFEMVLGEWENKMAADKPWDKTNFKAAPQQLKAIHGSTMQQVRCHHANHLANQLQQDMDMDARNTKIASLPQEAIDSQSQAPSTTPLDLSSNTSNSQQHQANTMQQDQMQL